MVLGQLGVKGVKTVICPRTHVGRVQKLKKVFILFVFFRLLLKMK